MTNIAMGEYYRNPIHGLVRTVCRAEHFETDDVFIAYVKIKDDGCVSDVFLMPEETFKTLFCH